MKELLVFANTFQVVGDLDNVLDFAQQHSEEFSIRAILTSCRSARILKSAMNKLGIEIPVGYLASLTEMPLLDGSSVMAPLRELEEGKPLALKVLYATKEKNLSLVLMAGFRDLGPLVLGYPGLMRSRVKEVHILNGRVNETLNFFIDSKVPIFENVL
jgi:hypothetical protein